MRPLRMAALGLVLAALPGCAGKPTPQDARLPVQIKSAELLQLESYPVQLMLHVEGWLPNACSTPGWKMETTGNQILVDLYAVPNGDKACIQVLAPFDVHIPLGAEPTRAVQILLNGDVIAEQSGGG